MAESRINVSNNNATAHIVASVTFPLGFDVEVKASDAAAFEFQNIDITSEEMTPNGAVVFWKPPQPLTLTLNVTPGTEECQNLETLFNANRIAANKTSANDVITLVLSYDNGQSVKLTNGHCKNYTPGFTVGQDGRTATKPFSFVFGNIQ